MKSTQERLGIVVLALSALVWSEPVRAVCVLQIFYPVGGVHIVGAATDPADGCTMAGTDVTFQYFDGTAETVTWICTDAAAGTGHAVAVVDPVWVLSLAGCSALNDFQLRNTGVPGHGGIQQISLDLRPGDTAADLGPPAFFGPGTPGSAGGVTWTLNHCFGAWNVDVFYRTDVAISGDAASPYGDLFAEIDILFVPVFDIDDELDFRMDTDGLILASPCEGDANRDGTVDPLDGGYVLARFGCPMGTGDPGCDAADVNVDGEVNPLDSGFVLARFGDCP